MWILSGQQTKQMLRRSCSELELQVVERTAELQNLSQRLLRVQDEERRTVARDLHDSTGQTLTALKICVSLLQRKLEKDDDRKTYDEVSGIARLVDEALQEIRTTSYLLHPPMLDESGFTSAAQWFVAGFAQRSGMKVRMNFAPELERLPAAVEIALFRVLQESLTNVHRHSGTCAVEVRFLRESQAAILEVRDYGRGMPKEWLSRVGAPVKDSGVGLAGMRERLNELKGGLEIEAADPGTRLRAIVPLPAERNRLAPLIPAVSQFPFAEPPRSSLSQTL
jgi:signal transduction histidine kinase